LAGNNCSALFFQAQEVCMVANSDAPPSTDELAKEAARQVREANAAFAAWLPEDDRRDFDDASRGFVSTLPDGIIRSATGQVLWDMHSYDFLQSDVVPPTVNPSLWRQAQLNLQHGLFEVMDGVYQVRGLDLANMTLIEGKTGLIVIDTMTVQEAARAGLELYRQHRGDRPIAAVIFTHTHTDHWGGAGGIISADDVRSGKTQLIAPDRFMEYAVSENIIAGNAMLRRGLFQFGRLLHRGPRGHVDNGLGKAQGVGTVGLIAPNDHIVETGETRVIDGIELVFQMAPHTEAPAEMHIFAPGLKLLNMAENATHNFHNLLPIRGAQVRNTLDWSRYINEALEMWGSEVEILVGQHHWPVWGNERIRQFLKIQRDLYKYVHDQTVRLMNLGHTPQEIAELIQLPPSIAREWHARGYYGAVRHNAKAIYQHYLGWYDAVPAHLDPLPPVETGRKFIEYMGGIDDAIRRARLDFAAGNFRWVAQVMNHAVFADPTHREARALLADAYEQLGYLAEAATWRNAYLNGAKELREGPPRLIPRALLPPDTLQAMTTGQLFDVLAIRLNGPRAAEKHIVVNWEFVDRDECYVCNLENATLTWGVGSRSAGAHVSVALTRPAFEQVVAGHRPIADLMANGEATSIGDADSLLHLFSLIDEPERNFEVVEPKQGSAR
jgi:alkyl sulfatase BDS1-like metallo-beta-lactamase superfamily hydrolase